MYVSEQDKADERHNQQLNGLLELVATAFAGMSKHAQSASMPNEAPYLYGTTLIPAKAEVHFPRVPKNGKSKGGDSGEESTKSLTRRPDNATIFLNDGNGSSVRIIGRKVDVRRRKGERALRMGMSVSATSKSFI